MGNKKRIEQVDKSRELYYNTVTDQKWGERRNYDLMINSGNIGSEAASSLIVSIAERRYKNDNDQRTELLKKARK